MSLILVLFEVGYLLQHFATITQCYRIYKKKSTEMVSLETNVFFLIGSLSRIGWIWDSMLKGFILSYIELTLGILSLITLIALFLKYKSLDFVYSELKFPIYCKPYVLLPLILTLSYFFHPGKKTANWFNSQMFVSLSIYSDAIGLIPQLYIISRQKDSGNISSWYIICLTIARFFRLLFWFQMQKKGKTFTGLMIADAIHTLFLFVFIYKFVKNWRSVVLPTVGQEQPEEKFKAN
jgi:ER lumen protein retaining receptor